jgi:hypothetical protein
MSANKAFATGFVRVREIADKMGLALADHRVATKEGRAPPASRARELPDGDD